MPIPYKRRFGLLPITPVPRPAAMPSRTIGEQPEQAAATAAANEARRAFCMYMQFRGAANYGERPMPQWDGGQTQFGANRQNIWPKVVTAAAEQGASPWEYVTALFLSAKATRIAPTLLLSQVAKDAWVEYCSRTPAETLRDFDYAIERLQAEFVCGQLVNMSESASWAYALRNMTVSAGPLVRHTLARQLDLDDVAAEFYDAAVAEYAMKFRFYSPTLDSRVALEVQQAGRDLRQRLMSGVS